MNIKQQLEKEHSKANTNLIAAYIGNDKSRFKELMQLFFDEEYRISQRAAHAVSYCADRYPGLLTPYVGKMIANLEKNPEVAIRRNTVRLLQNQNVPEEYQGLLVEKCFDYLLSAKETIAVKAFSMTILHNLTKVYPELRSELKLAIEDVLPHASAGVLNRGKKILAQLQD